MKEGVSSLELSALIVELRILAGSKVDKIYSARDTLYITFHKSGEGKKTLRIDRGKRAYLTMEREVGEELNEFSRQLRKRIGGARVEDIIQADSQRIIQFNLIKDKNYILIIELFSKGNVILCDDSWMILSVFKREVWKDRVVREKKEYKFPSGGKDIFSMDKKRFRESIHDSLKDSIVTALAADIGFGGSFAEEILARAELEKGILPKDLSDEEFERLYLSWKDLLKELKNPSGFIYKEEVSPIKLVKYGDEKPIIFDTFSEAIEEFLKGKVVLKKNPEYEKLRKSIEVQKRSVERLKKEIEINKRKAELIYENYGKINKILDLVRLNIRDKDRLKELVSKGLVKKVNLKEKKVVIEV